MFSFKKLGIITVPAILFAMQTIAQEPADALRYSYLTPSGSARNQAIGGAAVGLGGDITNTFLNPAGIGLFKTNEFVLTPGFSFGNNKSTYLGKGDKDSKSSFNFGSTGFIFAVPNNPTNKWRNFSFGIALNKMADFNTNVSLSGLNNQSSYSEKYLEELIGNNVTDPNAAANNYPYGSSLAFNTFLIDTISGAGGEVAGYRTQATTQTGLIQNERIQTKGGLSEFALAGSANLADKLFLGFGIGIDILNYTRNSSYDEADATGTQPNFDYFTVDEYLKTTGAGINLKLGAIFKPAEFLRLGLNVQTPTWYSMKDEYTTKVTTDLNGYGGPPEVKFQSSTDFNNGNPGAFEYNYRAPWRISGGVAFVFREDKDIANQKGFVTADVEWVDYGNSAYHTATSDTDPNADTYFDKLNTTIGNQYKNAFNFKLGGELKFKTIMARAGFNYYGNPQQQETFKSDRFNISGGLGYRDKGIFADLTYVQSFGKDGVYPYRLEQGPFSAATLKGSRGNILLTVGFKF